MPKIVFFITEDWYFLSHRRVLAQACLEAGWQVVVATRVNERGAEIQRAGFIVEPIPFDRGGKNPLRDLRTLAAIVRVLRKHHPDVLHSVGMKPLLYGNLAAAVTGLRGAISAFAGFGYLFTGHRPHLLLIRKTVTTLLSWLIKGRGGHLIVQNEDDYRAVLDLRLVDQDHLTLIPGSGVDLAALPNRPEPPAPPVIFTCVARMLRDKGIVELVEAARLLARQGIPALVRLVGGVDPANPTSLTEAELKAWQAEGIIEWLGHRSDIAAIWRDSHVAVLPSYREGMPKALLEAEACGRPVITTDVQGCREAIQDGVEGILVPVRQAAPLAEAMLRLTTDAALRQRMGQAARLRAETRFDQAIVVAKHLALYNRVINNLVV